MRGSLVSLINDTELAAHMTFYSHSFVTGFKTLISYIYNNVGPVLAETSFLLSNLKCSLCLKVRAIRLRPVSL